MKLIKAKNPITLRSSIAEAKKCYPYFSTEIAINYYLKILLGTIVFSKDFDQQADAFAKYKLLSLLTINDFKFQELYGKEIGQN